MKIKVKVLNSLCKPEIIEKGEWIDLKASCTVHTRAPYANTLKRNTKGDYRTVEFEYHLIPLGVVIQVPEGFEAIIAPRSSSFKNWSIIQTNSIGVIDETYCGPNDEWKLPCIAFKDGIILSGERVCQFRIQLKQKATIWQKLKWLLSNKIELEYVDEIDATNRGGIGSTGK